MSRDKGRGKAEDSFKVVMLMRLPESPVTGGEIYNHRLINYLKSKLLYFRNVSWQRKPWRNAFEFMFNSAAQNLSFLRMLNKVDSGTMILEDNSQSSDLFLFNIAARMTRRLTGRKIALVSLVHHTYAPLMAPGIKRKLKFIEEGLFLNSQDGIITVSEFTKSLIDEALRRDVKFVIAPPGLNLSGLGEDILRKPRKDGVHLLFVGYFDTRKGIDTLIKAFEMVVKEKGLDQSILHVVGDVKRGDIERGKALYQELNGYSDKAGLSNRIIFHGRVSDQELRDLYRSSDIFVFPSRWEGFGMALAEAMSFGLPIVTTNAGAIPYLVKDGINGLLVPPGDPERLAQAIKQLAGSPKLRAKFSEANRKLASEFDWDKSFSKVIEFIEAII